jgi:hypothetical protein
MKLRLKLYVRAHRVYRNVRYHISQRCLLLAGRLGLVDVIILR